MNDVPADPGLARRGISRSTAFALVTFAFVVTMLGATLPTPVYPLYQQQFHLGDTMLTVIYATYAAGVIIALVLFGPLSDQVGRRRMLLAGLGLSAASAVAFLVAGDISTLLAGRALAGLAAGIVTGTATAALLDLAPAHRPGRASLVAAAANVGGLGVGPLLAGGLAAYAPLPTRLCFLVHLLLVAAAAVGVAVMPEPRRTGGRVRLRLQRVRVPAAMLPTFVRAAAPGFAGFAVLGLFTAVAAPLLGVVMHQTNPLLTGVLACAGFAASLVGQLLSTAMTERRGLLSGCAVLVVAAALVAASLAVESLPLLVGAAVAAGIGQGTSFRAGLAMVTSRSPAGQRAAVASAYFTTAYVALSIPVVGVGAGAERFGWATSAMTFAAVVGLLPLVALIGLARDRRPGSPPLSAPAPPPLPTAVAPAEPPPTQPAVQPTIRPAVPAVT
jgi:MFS family permease